MSLGVLMFSGTLGFISAILSGLVLGLGFLAAIGVYLGVGIGLAFSMFVIRGLFCAAARQLA